MGRNFMGTAAGGVFEDSRISAYVVIRSPVINVLARINIFDRARAGGDGGAEADET
jgi:hypothetical protein